MFPVFTVPITNSSHLLPVLSEILQGSILGPLLFLIYVNDIPDYVSISLLLYLFAKYLKTITDPTDSIRLQNDVISLCYWSEQWSLLFNPTKIIQITFKSNLQTSYTIGTSSITKVESHKDLGIILSSNSTWDAHHNQIIAKAYRVVKKNFLTSDPHQEQKTTIAIYLLFDPNYCIALFYGKYISSNTSNKLNKYNGEPPNIF